MAIAITPSTTQVYAGRTVTFAASGGTGPYVFSMVSGAGSINSSTGVYTAPGESGSAVVKVTDSLRAVAQATIDIENVLTLFCDVIQEFMDLDDDQVYLWDQKIDIPTDDRLYVAVAVLSCKPFGNNRKMVSVPNAGLNQEVSTNFQATFDVNILSRGKAARDRKEEVILALRSIYSQQTQERYGFYIAGISSSFVNLSQIDGAAIPYRFNISVNVQYAVSKTKSSEYYDDFTDEVITEE